MGDFDLTLGTLLIGIFCESSSFVCVGWFAEPCVVNTYLFGLVTFQFAAYYKTSMSYF